MVFASSSRVVLQLAALGFHLPETEEKLIKVLVGTVLVMRLRCSSSPRTNRAARLACLANLAEASWLHSSTFDRGLRAVEPVIAQMALKGWRSFRRPKAAAPLQILQGTAFFLHQLAKTPR